MAAHVVNFRLVAHWSGALVIGIWLCAVAAGPAEAGCVSGDCANGYGTYLFDSGDKYVGSFRNGTYHGQGTYTFANGCAVGSRIAVLQRAPGPIDCPESGPADRVSNTTVFVTSPGNLSEIGHYAAFPSRNRGPWSARLVSVP